MGLFEFLMILMSVVIGLALSEVLTGAAGMLRDRDSIHFYWIHSLFQVGVFIALLQQWWESWDFVDVVELRFLSVLSLLLPAVVLYLIAHLLNPRPMAKADLRDYYYRQAPVLWGLVLLGTFLGTFVEPLLSGDEIFQLANISGIPMIAICTSLALSNKRGIHSVLAPLVIVLLILDTWLVNPAISAS